MNYSESSRLPDLRALPLLVVVGAIALFAFAVLPSPAFYRPLVAVLVTGSLAVVALRQPGAALVLTFGFLVVLALARRLLIPLAGWTSYDPLLLVAPAISVVLLARLWLARERTYSRDWFPKLVGMLLVLILVQALNPLGGGILAGLTGLLFLATPLIWFFIGRDIDDPTAVRAVVVCVICSASLVAIYGLSQTLLGLPPWDSAWVQVGGYTALRVAGVLKAFGSFASSTEYATYLGVALVLCVAMALHRRWFALAPIPLLAWALALTSNRTVVVLCLLSIAILAGLRMRDPRLGVAAVTVILLVTVLTVRLVGPGIEASAQDSSNTLVAHLVGGLVDPLNPDQSTLLLHLQRIGDGLRLVAANPLGLGTAATNIAGDKLNTTTARTEVDLSNAFVSLGLPGGLLFLVIVIVVFWRAIRSYLTRRELISLGIAGALIVSLGQWLNGGQYAVAPLIWFLIGWATPQIDRWSAERRA